MSSQFWIDVLQIEIDPATGKPISSIATREYFKPEHYSSGFTGNRQSNIFIIEAKPNPTEYMVGDHAWEWTVSIPDQPSAHDNAFNNNVEVWEQNIPERK